MNNGLSAFNRSEREQPLTSTASIPSISNPRWLVGALCWASIGASVVVSSCPAFAKASATQEAVPPQSSQQLASDQLLAQDQPAEASDEPIAEPIEPTMPAVEPVDSGLPSITRPNPVDEPAPVAEPVAEPIIQPASPPLGINQIPTLPPQSGPRFDQPLIRPNTVTPTLDPTFEDYHLGPGDAVFVSVQRYPELSFQATLDLQGNVIVPIQGAINLEGLTLQETEGLLRGIYNQYVVIDSARDVAVTLVGRRGVEVTILGAVQRPGFYPLADPSVSTALLTAGGATRTSDLRGIQVQRQLRRQGGIVQETVNVDLFTPLKEGAPLPDLRLEDGDVLVVPELDASQLDDYDSFLVARSTLAQPIINVRFLNYAGGRGGVGTLNLNNGSSFLDAITVLGVNPDNANLGDVALIRYDPETGRAVTVSLDAKSAILGDITQNPPLQDSDVVVVGRNLIGRLSFALQTITRPFRDVFGFTRFLDDALNDGLFNNN